MEYQVLSLLIHDNIEYPEGSTVTLDQETGSALVALNVLSEIAKPASKKAKAD